jgi:hypothetical protein
VPGDLLEVKFGRIHVNGCPLSECKPPVAPTDRVSPTLTSPNIWLRMVISSSYRKKNTFLSAITSPIRWTAVTSDHPQETPFWAKSLLYCIQSTDRKIAKLTRDVLANSKFAHRRRPHGSPFVRLRVLQIQQLREPSRPSFSGSRCASELSKRS